MVTVGLSPWAKSVVLHRIIGAMASFGSTYKAQERAHSLEEIQMENQLATIETEIAQLTFGHFVKRDCFSQDIPFNCI